MLSIHHLEILQARLRSVSAIVDLQQKRLYSFPEKVLEWLRGTEKDLENAHLSIVSQISGLRSQLLVTIHGCEAAASKRKRWEEVASSVLREAQQIISQAISPKLEVLRESNELAMRIVAVAKAKGIIDKAREIPSHHESIRFIQNAMGEDSDTAAAMVHLIGLLGTTEVLIILDRAIPDL
jgi:hypothetical protein